MDANIDAAGRDRLLGRKLGGSYRLERLARVTGIGRIYRARIEEGRAHPRKVAVEVLRPMLADDVEAKRRFEQMASCFDAIQHDNLLSLLDRGCDGDLDYLVTEWIEGERLDHRLASDGRLGLAKFVPLASQILEGVGYAHTRDVILGDLCPTNIVLAPSLGRGCAVKVVSCGPTRLTDRLRADAGVRVIGTAELAPEQIRRSARVDLRADVYGLGMVFYQMLSGRPPFEAADLPTLLRRHVHDCPTPLSERVTGLPEGLVELVHDCLEKRPEARPRDANEVMARLNDCAPAPRLRRSGASGGSEPGEPIVDLALEDRVSPVRFASLSGARAWL